MAYKGPMVGWTPYLDRSAVLVPADGSKSVKQCSGGRRRRALLSGWAAGWFAAITVSGALAAGAAAPPPGDKATEAGASLLVYGAASLTDALGDAARVFGERTGVDVKTSFASSSVLAKQIEAGAPAGVFISADPQWMDYLAQRGLLKAGSRHDLLGNRLVLIAPADSRVALRLRPGADLAAALGAGGRLAAGDPDGVPAGRYARAALTKLGLWNQVSAQLVRAENVRAALEYVARGEAPLGIVYRTDALADRRVRIIDTFPASSHPPIIYPLALTASAGPAAARFATFLESPAARQIFARYGFEPLP
jgi:molybdate transport system substrate-binding protein